MYTSYLQQEGNQRFTCCHELHPWTGQIWLIFSHRSFNSMSQHHQDISGPTHLSTVDKVYTPWLNTHQPDSVRSHLHGVRIWTSSFSVSKFSVFPCSSWCPISNTTITDVQESTIATANTPLNLLTTMSDSIQSHVLVELQQKVEKFEKVTFFTLFMHAW
jgi:hypothetical protein